MKKKNTTPLVSVLIPVFNGAQYLVEAVESVYQSTYTNFEIILVDDGSTDASVALCEKLDKRYSKVRFFGFNKNRGLTRVLNFGISKAKGKYIARINQDDLMVKKRLEWQVEFLENNPDHVAVGGWIRMFSNNKKGFETVRFAQTDEELKKMWLMLSPFSDPTVMYRKDTFLQTKGYSQKFWPGDDVHMWYQLGSLGKLANLPKILTKVRWHNGAGSIKFHKLQMQKTWELHMYARKHIAKPSTFIWIFWIAELLAGYVLPPRINWMVYRIIKRTLALNWSFGVSMPSFSFPNRIKAFSFSQ